MKKLIPLLIALCMTIDGLATVWVPKFDAVPAELRIDKSFNGNRSLAPLYEMPDPDDEDTATIDIEVANYPDMSYYFLGLYCITPEKEVYIVPLDAEYKVSMIVKAGESYDFVAHYWGSAVSFLYLSAEYFDIKEGVVGTDDGLTTLYISPENCTLTLRPRATNPQGEPWELNRDLSGWCEYDESGNATSMWGTMCLTYEDTYVCGSLMQQLYAPYGEGYETSMDMYDIHVPAFSDSFTFSLGVETLAKTNMSYYDTYEFNGAQEDITASDSGENYQLCSETFDYPVNTGTDMYYAGVISDVFINEEYFNGWSNNGNIPTEKAKPVEFCINKNDVSSVNYQLKPLFVEIMQKDDSYKSFPMYGAPMDFNTPGYEPRYVVKNGPVYGSMSFANPDDAPVVSAYEGHPVFSYDATQRNGNYGSLAPICAIDYNPNVFYNSLDIRYTGPYGEIRTCDLMDMTVAITTDGEVNSEVTDYFSLEYFKFLVDKKHTLHLTDNSITVDGVKGINECTVEFDLAKDNRVPPSLRMLQIRNANGEITNELDNPDDGIIYFAAADIEIIDNAANFLVPSQVTLEYALLDSDEFTALPVVMMADEYYANFGSTYKVELADMADAVANSWYKLRITLVDEAGNSMTQTFGPAFMLSNTKPESKPQEIVWDQTFEGVEIGDVITLTANATSGLEVTYTITIGEDLATISGSTLTINGAGRIVITASQEGNEEWLAATPVEKTIESTSGIMGIVDESEEVVYFDMQGRCVTNPAPGVYIKRQGTRSRKVVIR